MFDRIVTKKLIKNVNYWVIPIRLNDSTHFY